MADYLPAASADKAKVVERYKQLCALRDAINAETAPLRKEKERLAVDADEANRKARIAAENFHNARGGAKWTALKNEIGQLARLLPPVGDNNGSV